MESTFSELHDDGLKGKPSKRAAAIEAATGG